MKSIILNEIAKKSITVEVLENTGLNVFYSENTMYWVKGMTCPFNEEGILSYLERKK